MATTRLRMTIDIEVDDTLTAKVGLPRLSDQDIRELVQTAFGDYNVKRGDVKAYIAERYPNDEDHAWLNRGKKEQEIRVRLVLANEIRNGAAFATFLPIT